jgi:glutaredoxin 3
MNNIIIWTRNNCDFCTQAKELLKKNNLLFEERNVDSELWTRNQLKEILPNASTFPQIFINDVPIGGFKKLKEKFHSS